MSMRGTWTPRLDEKYRLTLPAKYRLELTAEVTVVCEQERCLAIYARDVLDAMMDPINAAPSTRREVREYQRWAQYRAEDATPDKQGRVTLTPTQRTWAGLDKDVVVIGAGNRLEVWNPETWDAYAAELDAKFADFDGDIVPVAAQG
ncbi:MAG: division/cell wall cluster transcriptional repressor MraZ [Propionibacteriaceae bacterium]|nr:division/cell wall cluster transcriptional repressor MraZ [Propionibacteriaceae bacterium]